MRKPKGVWYDRDTVHRLILEARKEGASEYDGLERKRIGTVAGMREQEKMGVEWQKAALANQQYRNKKYGSPTVLGMVGINIREFFIGLLRGKVD